MNVLDRFLKEHPEIAETLEVMMDKELMQILDESQKAVDRGETFPLQNNHEES